MDYSWYLAALGWFVGYWIALKQDRERRKRDFITNLLVESYRTLESASNRGFPLDEPYKRDIESALADLQLLGNEQQIKMTKAFIEKLVNNEQQNQDTPEPQAKTDTTELLQKLRNDLRKELRLSGAKEPPVIFRA